MAFSSVHKEASSCRKASKAGSLLESLYRSLPASLHAGHVLGSLCCCHQSLKQNSQQLPLHAIADTGSLCMHRSTFDTILIQTNLAAGYDLPTQ